MKFTESQIRDIVDERIEKALTDFAMELAELFGWTDDGK